MGTKSFDAIYKNAPRHQVDELLEFRSTHPVQQRSIDGIEWKYIFSGTGSETIVIMGGPLSTPEILPVRRFVTMQKQLKAKFVLINPLLGKQILAKS
jgi:hypothetical protein